MKVKIVKEVKRSGGLWRFACGDVFTWWPKLGNQMRDIRIKFSLNILGKKTIIHNPPRRPIFMNIACLLAYWSHLARQSQCRWSSDVVRWVFIASKYLNIAMLRYFLIWLNDDLLNQTKPNQAASPFPSCSVYHFFECLSSLCIVTFCCGPISLPGDQNSTTRGDT